MRVVRPVRVSLGPEPFVAVPLTLKRPRLAGVGRKVGPVNVAPQAAIGARQVSLRPSLRRADTVPREEEVTGAAGDASHSPTAAFRLKLRERRPADAWYAPYSTVRDVAPL